jgi:bacillithiol biosynthesis cysteine-adding enzyme BshC
LASDDSDFQEVHSTFFFGEDDELFSVRYPDEDNDRSRMAGTVSLGKVGDCLKHLQDRGLKGEFQGEVVDMLREAYHPTKNFSEGLGSWLSRLFEPYGLVLFDPLTPGYKRDLKSLFHIAVSQRREIVQALTQRADLLREKGFSPQVRVSDSESLIFWTEGNKRYKLEYGGKTGYEKKTDLAVGLSEEERLQAMDAEHLAPNVLLRPILQDHLFPTVAYVGGASEVAYFAQIGAISPFWDQEMAVFPRLGVTIVDRKSQRLLKKYGITASDLLQLTSEEVSRKVLQGSDSGKILKKLKHVQGDMRAQLRSLQDELQLADSTVAEMLVGTEKKIIYQIEKIEKRFVANHRTRTENFGQHLDYLYSRLHPQGKLQERVVNFNQFLSEEGTPIVERLMEAVNPFCPSHHLIYL